MDDGIERAVLVCLFRHTLRLGEVGQIPDDGPEGLVPDLAGVREARLVPGVQHHFMALLNQRPGSVEPESAGRTGDEYSRHSVLRSALADRTIRLRLTINGASRRLAGPDRDSHVS